MSKTKLLLVPFAGGCSYNFKSIFKLLSENFDCICFDSHGHGINAHLPFNTSFQQEKTEYINFIKNNTNDEDYVAWGYSFGGIITFEALRDLQNEGYPLPKKLFLSGVKPPAEFVTPDTKPMSDQDLLPFLLSMNENQDPESGLKYVGDIRPALEICSDYKFQNAETKLKVDTCIMTADRDVVTQDGVDNWVHYIDGNVTFGHFKGKHFFYRQDTDNVVNFINQNVI